MVTKQDNKQLDDTLEMVEESIIDDDDIQAGLALLPDWVLTELQKI